MEVHTNDHFIRRRPAGRTEQRQGWRTASGRVDNEIGGEDFLPSIGGFTPDACDHGAIGRRGDLAHPAPRAHRQIGRPRPAGA